MDRARQPVHMYMTPAPVRLQQEADLASAAQLMQEHEVRHLPVMHGQHVVGIVSERDLAIAEALVPGDWERFPVAEAMTPEPHSVTPDTDVKTAAAVMAKHKHGCVLVVDATGQLSGIFTTVDALRVLAAEG